MVFKFVASIALRNYIVPTLRALSVSPANFAFETPESTVIGAIGNKTNGSTVSITPADDRVAIVGKELVVGTTPADAGTFDITLRETFAGANGSPRDTVITITVNPA